MVRTVCVESCSLTGRGGKEMLCYALLCRVDRCSEKRDAYWAMLLVLTRASMSTLSELHPFRMVSSNESSTGVLTAVSVSESWICCNEPESAFQLRCLSRSACRLKFASGNVDKGAGTVLAVSGTGGSLNVVPSTPERSAKASRREMLWPRPAEPAFPDNLASGAAGGVSGESCAFLR